MADTTFRFEFKDTTVEGSGPSQPATSGTGGIAPAFPPAPGVDQVTTTNALRDIADLPFIGPASRQAADFIDRLEGVMKSFGKLAAPATTPDGREAARRVEAEFPVLQAPIRKPAPESIDYPRSKDSAITAAERAAELSRLKAAADLTGDQAAPAVRPDLIIPPAPRVAQHNAAGQVLSLIQPAPTARAAAVGQAAGVAGAAGRAAPAAAAIGAAPLGGAAAALAALGPLAVAAGGATVGLKVMSDAAVEFGSRLIERGKALQDFSPELSRAAAQNELNELRANFRSAQDFGGNLSRVSTARADADRALTRIADVASDVIAAKMLPLLETAASTLEAIAEHEGAIRVATEAVETGAESLPVIGKAIAALEVIATGIGLVVKDQAKKNDQALQEADNYSAWFNKQEPLQIGEGFAVTGENRTDVRFDGTGGVELP
jgi:hypothetical protein